MILQIEVSGRTRAVEVGRSGDRFLVSIDGRQHEVDVRTIGEVMSLLVGPPEGGPHRPFRSYEVTLGGSASDGVMMVHVDGMPVEVSIIPSRPSWGPSTTLGASGGRGAASHGTAEGPQHIKAPMPGKIVKLLVKPGDKVEPRQGLVVVEAMKMENELRARAAGTVSEVRVTEGSSVEAGAILIVIE